MGKGMQKILIKEMDVNEDRTKLKIEKVETKPLEESRLYEKTVFVCTCVVTVVLSHCAIYIQWLLPYIYCFLTPVLLGIRIATYWRNKWQYFLIDFCYLGNTFLVAFLCAPYQPYLFMVTFAIGNGPLFWAMMIYRNSFVFHHIDKVTSIYIHIMPTLITFSARWFPERISQNWFTEFMPESPEFSVIWLVLVPLGCFMLHLAIYLLIVRVLVKPSEEYVTSYNFLGEKDDSRLYKMFNWFGPRGRCAMFYLWNTVYCALSLIISMICYFFFEVHCILIVIVSVIVIWNGASYYMHVFSVRGFVTGIEH